MAFQLSPGVNISEIDLTTVVPGVGASTGAYVGTFFWGPIDEIVQINNEIELVDRFGKPKTANNQFRDFYTCANFLAYGNDLKVVRSADTDLANNSVTGAEVDGGGDGFIFIKNKDDYEINYFDLSADANVGFAAARYAGVMGDSLKVSVCAANGTATFTGWSYASDFNGAPGTSTYVSNLAGANDEMHIIVVDEDGKFTGTANTVLEKFAYVSQASDATNDDGSSNYYVNVINDRSKYIYIMNHDTTAMSASVGNTAAGVDFTGTEAANVSYSFSGGADGNPATGDIQTSYDLFVNKDEVDVSLIMTGAHEQTVSEYVVDNIAEVRKDCVVFISPQFSDVVNNAGAEASSTVNQRNNYNSSSYAVFDSAWKYQFDKYNNVYRWIPLNGDIAGLCVRTDAERDPWFSPAGFNRGHIKNVTKLSWNPKKADRDTLYKNGINPVVSFPGEGVVLYGDKTMLAKPSAFDRINVRRLFIVLEKAIERASRYSLFEFNDEFTRAQFVALVEPFLRDVQGRRGIYDFRVVCDGTNNTPEVIDRNEFVGDIYIKPARSINFIQLNFVAVRTGVAFSEVVGQF
jgi:phage tail sheath protein FI